MPERNEAIWNDQLVFEESECSCEKGLFMNRASKAYSFLVCVHACLLLSDSHTGYIIYCAAFLSLDVTLTIWAENNRMQSSEQICSWQSVLSVSNDCAQDVQDRLSDSIRGINDLMANKSQLGEAS